MVIAVPSVFWVGGTQRRVALPFDTVAAVTVIVKPASAADVFPSLTLTTMFAYVPTFVLAGVPLTWPVAILKLAHEGLFCTLKLSVSPFASLAVGVKE